MTNEEALRRIKAECIGCCHPQAMEYCEHNCEVGIAINCIEKQIPKEAKYHISGNGWNDWLVFTCPVCGKEFKDSLICPCCYQRVKPYKESDNE